MPDLQYWMDRQEARELIEQQEADRKAYLQAIGFARALALAEQSKAHFTDRLNEHLRAHRISLPIPIGDVEVDDDGDGGFLVRAIGKRDEQ